jgi:hypothetical protein
VLIVLSCLNSSKRIMRSAKISDFDMSRETIFIMSSSSRFGLRLSVTIAALRLGPNTAPAKPREGLEQGMGL